MTCLGNNTVTCLGNNAVTLLGHNAVTRFGHNTLTRLGLNAVTRFVALSGFRGKYSRTTAPHTSAETIHHTLNVLSSHLGRYRDTCIAHWRLATHCFVGSLFRRFPYLLDKIGNLSAVDVHQPRRNLLVVSLACGDELLEGNHLRLGMLHGPTVDRQFTLQRPGAHLWRRWTESAHTQ